MKKMKSLDEIKSVYFIGAGGSGMSTLARYFLSKGKNVAGYDLSPSKLINQLISEGAKIHCEIDNERKIPAIYRDKASTLVIYSPAVPSTNREAAWFFKNQFETLSRAKALGAITRPYRQICVSGTHGKTTTSCMIAHLLKQSPIDCTAFLGGIAKNYGTNYLEAKKSNWAVIEADEYAGAFHEQSPDIAIITSVSYDHTDIYESPEAYRNAFARFTSQIRENGYLLLEASANFTPETGENVTTYRYTGDLEASKLSEKDVHFYAQNVRWEKGKIHFDCVMPGTIISDIRLAVPVEINIVNAVAALAAGWLAGIKERKLKKGMDTFLGVERRFDIIVHTKRFALINDYAHHPEELAATINSIRKMFPDCKKLHVIFQPHLYSRTRDFYKEFAAALSKADEIYLAPIYPAREEPIEGVCSEMIMFEIPGPKVCVFSHKETVPYLLRHRAPNVVLVAGAGDIDSIIKPIRETLHV
jgi:UDP-N-acetylmuramate--alanine ligase